MFQTMVSLRDAERTVHIQIHDGLVDVMVAALSAEPATVSELTAAMGRFVESSVVEAIRERIRPGLGRDVTDGGHLIVDMTAKLLVNGTDLPEMPRVGSVLCCDEHTTLDLWLPYRMPDDWRMVRDMDRWEALADARRREFEPWATLDARAVLYGRLAESLVRRCRATVGKSSGDLEVEIHDWWLLTRRDDLRQRTPRDVLLARRQFIDGDVQDQGQTWTLLGKCPPGLAHSAQAFRYGGFGSQEIILYHDLVATMLRRCAERLGNGAEADEQSEIRHLEQFQQEWLHQPSEELYDQSPAALIARERARLPFVVPKSHAVLHDDCPLCRMMADGDTPMIWALDSYQLTERFATSFYATVAEWEEDRWQWPDDDDTTTDTPEDVVPVEDPEHMGTRIWHCSFTNMSCFSDMSPREACGVMLFSVGGHLAELVQDLRRDADADPLVQQLHQRFDELRVLIREEEDVWMINTSIAEFGEALHAVAATRRDLGAKCDDLEDKLDFLASRYADQFGQDQEAAY